MKTIMIEVPDDCEVRIIKKEKKEPVIRTYQDLIDNNKTMKGYWINSYSVITATRDFDSCNICRNVAISEKVAKSMLAMAQISQLMPYYGGAITDKEWKETNWTTKYTIDRVEESIVKDSWSTKYHFLAFHTAKQRDEFLKYNKQLVKDYLMIG